MGTALQVGDIGILRAWTSLAAQAAVNTYGWAVLSTVGGGATDQDFTNGMDTGVFSTFYKSLMGNSAVYRGLQWYFLKRTSGGLPAPVKSTAGAGNGTGGLDPIPLNTCPIFKYATVNRGQSGRGRLYLPFAAAVYMSNLGEPTAALDVLINGLASILLVPTTVTVGGNSATLVWSLIHRQPKPNPPSVSSIITAESASKFGQMHKRGDYGRPNQSPI